MAFLDKSKANYAFKALLGKAHTSNGRELSNEAIPSGIILSAARIFADSINTNPSDPSNTGIVSAQVTLVLEAIAGSDTFTLGEYQGYRAKLGGSVPASLVGITNPITGAPYAANDYVGNIIPQSFGDNYRPILYSDAAATVEIPPSSAADWFIDCYAGIVVQEGSEDGGTPFILGANGRLKAYIYTGRFVKDALSSGGSGGGSGSSEWLDSARGFSQDLIGGTNAFFNFYDNTALTNHIDQSLLINGLRWIHIGSTVSGLNIYNPTTNTFSTGSVSNNDVVQYYVSMGTSGTIGYIKTTPSTGTSIVFDADTTNIFRFTGSTWIATGVTVSNGLTKTGNNIALGGALNQDTTILGENYSLTIGEDGGASNTSGNSNSLSNFKVGVNNQINFYSGTVDEINAYMIIDPNFATMNVANANNTGDLASLSANLYGIHGRFNDQTNPSINGSFDMINGGYSLGYAEPTFATQFNMNSGGIESRFVDQTASSNTSLNVFNTNILVSTANNPTFAGVQYDIDYSANYTNRSLVDKGYVDAKIVSSEFVLNNGSGTTAVNHGTAGSVNLGGPLTADVQIGDNTYNHSFDVYANGAGLITGDNSTYSAEVNMGNVATNIDRTDNANKTSAISLTNNSISVSASDATVGSSNIFVNSTQYVMSAQNTANTEFSQITYNTGASLLELDVLSDNFDPILLLKAENDTTNINTQIQVATGPNAFLITDNRQGANQSGIEYAADYSVNYTTRSLVDKGYVDNRVATSSAVPTSVDKYLVPSAGTNGTSGNGLTTGLNITYTPTNDGYVEVLVNGIGVHLGTSSSNGDGYFAAPGSGGSVGRLIANIQSGDEFFWNGSLAGYYLDSGDVVDFLYNITS